MDLIYSPRALREMEEIAECIQQDSPRSALRFLDAIEKTCEQLQTFPEMGARLETDEPALQGFRYFLVSGFAKYVIFYSIPSGTLRVERVVHGSRDLPNFLKEAL